MEKNRYKILGLVFVLISVIFMSNVFAEIYLLIDDTGTRYTEDEEYYVHQATKNIYSNKINNIEFTLGCYTGDSSCDSYSKIVVNHYDGTNSTYFNHDSGEDYDSDFNLDDLEDKRVVDLDIYLMGSEDGADTAYFDDLLVYTILDSNVPIVIDINNPSSLVSPTQSYDWNTTFRDVDNNSDYTYEYSFGLNDTNSFDGNETYIDTNEMLDYDIEGEYTNKHFDLNYTPTIDQLGETKYSFFTVHKYLNGNYEDTNIAWSDDTFDVNWGRLTGRFYDENSGEPLDSSVDFTVDGADIDVNSDGYFEEDLYNLLDTNGQAVTITASYDGYSTRHFDDYLYYTQSYDYNYFLLPDENTESIEFSVQDINGDSWANKYMAFQTSDSNIIEKKLLDSEGKGTYNILSDGDYNAYLYDEDGNFEHMYQKSTVEMKKPKDEITNNDISPYDVTVGGLLRYSLTNQSDAQVNFNVFAGTIDYYNFTVVDYNSTPADRKYLPRRYFVRIPMGEDYTKSYALQPYLMNETDAVFLNTTVINTIGTTIPDTQLLLYKYVSGSKEIMASQTTDMLGKTTFALYPNDDYYLYVYYNDVLQLTGFNNIRITKDTDMTITLDITTEGDIEKMWSPTISWKESKGMFNLNDENINILAEVNSNFDMKEMTIELYNGGNQVYSDTVAEVSKNYDINYTINGDVITDPFLSGKVKITVVNQQDPTVTRTFTRLIAFTDRSMTPKAAFTQAGEELGQPLSTIIAIVMVGVLLAFAIFSAGIVDPRIITALGLFGMSIFLYFGWLNSGVTVFGTDISVFIYAMVVVAYVLSLARRVR